MLSTDLSDSPELKQRSEREPKTISQLNHSNICTLYDVGHQEGTDYLVMEFVEGGYLAERLKHGPPLNWEADMRYTGIIHMSLVVPARVRSALDG